MNWKSSSYAFITVVLMLTVLLTAQWVYGESERPFRLESLDFNVTGDHGPYTIQSYDGADSYEATSTSTKLTIDIESDVCYWNRIVVLVSSAGEGVTANIVVEQPCYMSGQTGNTQSSSSAQLQGAAADGSQRCPDWTGEHSHNQVHGTDHRHVALGNLDPRGSYISHRHTFAWDSEVQDCNTQSVIKE